MLEQPVFKTPKQHRVAVVAGLRTPFAKQATDYRGIPALELGQWVVNELLIRMDLDPSLVDRLVFGQVIQMPEAPNIAREIVLGTQLNVHTDAFSVSRACATSFQSIANVVESIVCGQIDVGIAGGADSASVLPITVSKKLADNLLDLSRARSLLARLKILGKLKLKDLKPVPPAVAEYLTGLRMGDTAEQMAKSYGISRMAQDDFAHQSHVRANQAWAQGILKEEVMTVHVPPYQSFITEDNTVRKNSDISSYARLKPAFDKRYGTVTAGNASPLTDGAAAVLLMREDVAQALGYKPLGYIRSYAFTAIDVWEDMLLGPAYASPLALDYAGLSLQDLTLIDMHEAFAAQTLVNVQMFESEHFAQKRLNRPQALGAIEPDKFNVLGGSIAYGHPFAATGARMVTQTLRELQRRGGQFALNTACAAGGLGAAMILEAA